MYFTAIGLWGCFQLVVLLRTATGDSADDPGVDGSQVVSARLIASPDRPRCAQSTTLSFCLEDSSYPSDDIQREINANYGVFYKMYADVTNQSTASLVEGVGADQESKLDYAFYYGDKRNSLSSSTSKDRPAYSNYVFRDDYYKDGGYVCPAFIEYTSLFQATNARGEWQYIVNLKPWTQTVRLEQCFYPLAPCSYMSPSFKTQCVQKYSYQRLIAYEPQGRGLYTDVFRLPTACSCYINPVRIQSLGALQSDASQIVGSSSSYAPAFGYPPQTSNAISNGFKPVRVRNPPRGPGYAPAALQNGDPWFTPSAMSASDLTGTESGPPPETRLVERRRIRPDGLSLADITSDPEVNPSDYGFVSPPNQYLRPDQGPEPIRPPGPQPSRNPNVMYGPPQSGQGPYQGPQQFQGDESHYDPSYSNGPYSGNGNSAMSNQGGPPGPRMFSDTPSDFPRPGQQPPGNAPRTDYHMSQGPGYYDYNSAQHN